jgi:hypothetical protein
MATASVFQGSKLATYLVGGEATIVRYESTGTVMMEVAADNGMRIQIALLAEDVAALRAILRGKVDNAKMHHGNDRAFAVALGDP